jgi:hypothetical protein
MRKKGRGGGFEPGAKRAKTRAQPPRAFAVQTQSLLTQRADGHEAAVDLGVAAVHVDGLRVGSGAGRHGGGERVWRGGGARGALRACGLSSSGRRRSCLFPCREAADSRTRCPAPAASRPLATICAARCPPPTSEAASDCIHAHM